MIAAYSSTRIFRSDRGAAAKYSLSGLLSVGAVAAFFASVVGMQLAISSIAPASKFALDQVAQATNAQLPMVIDEHTELVRVEGLKGVLVYHYRLTQVSSGQVSGETLVQRLRAAVSANACADSESRERFLGNGVVLRYAYSDAENNSIGHFDVSAEDCR